MTACYIVYAMRHDNNTRQTQNDRSQVGKVGEKNMTTQDALQQIYDQQHPTLNTAYDWLPSDCRGDGYDIALTARPDESAVYTLKDDTVATITCTAKVGSTRWDDGIPAMYTLTFSRPQDRRRLTINDSNRRMLNVIARRNGYHHCTDAWIDPSCDHVRIEYTPYGFLTNSGRFFPGVKTTRYPWGGHYSPAITIIYLPPSHDLAQSH